MFVKLNNKEIFNYEDALALYEGKELIIGIDSSKSNTGIAVAEIEDNVIKEVSVLEVNGEFDGTSEEQCFFLCTSIRKFLHNTFKNSFIRLVGIENVITKQFKDRFGKYTGGMNQHMSRVKITSVFSEINTEFMESFQKVPMLINNQAWKSAILPAEFRTADNKKGSQLYMASLNPKYAGYSDDATDALCILMYIYRYLRTPKFNTPVDNLYNGSMTLRIVDKRRLDEQPVFLYNKDIDFITNLNNAITLARTEEQYNGKSGLLVHIDNIPIIHMKDYVDRNLITVDPNYLIVITEGV